MIKYRDIKNMTIDALEKKYPFVLAFFENNNLDPKGFEEKTVDVYFEHFTEEAIENWAIDINGLKEDLPNYIMEMLEFLGITEENETNSLTIIAGQDKSGNLETFGSFSINKGEIISIVGPTGSGKSRLLADIEWTANGDTPTKRSILINDQKPDMKWRFSSSNKLVAQLSQNMNFVMDLNVKEFIELHARSRMVENESEVISKIIKAANHLAGEKFDLDTSITSLSGGQSRALMIADTAILSTSPIVLIDEIENAGINRKKALNLLINEDKIVLMATHDPILALMADKRIIIENGGIADVIITSEKEKNMLVELQKMDLVMSNLRTSLRNGEIIERIN